MSSEESQNSANSAENSTKSDSGSDGELALRGQYAMLHLSHSFAYDDEPLEELVQNADINPEDPDGLLPATLEERSNGSIDLNQW